MFYVLNKNKIMSYTIASFIVLALFAFSTAIIPNEDISVMKVSSNIINESNKNVMENFDKKDK